ncbi:MAG: ferritin [Candidatus Thermoplasmatota archaeon]
MLSKKMEQSLNKQINAELWSAYLYLSMASYFEALNLKGFANWMWVQAREETTHAMRIYQHVVDRGGRVFLTSIDTVPTEWKSPLHAFEETLTHEEKVTSMINNLVNIAISEKDHATGAMLQWFVNEQVEEEASAHDIIQQLKLIGKDTSGLFMLDKQLGTRVFTPPADLSLYTSKTAP